MNPSYETSSRVTGMRRTAESMRPTLPTSSGGNKGHAGQVDKAGSQVGHVEDEAPQAMAHSAPITQTQSVNIVDFVNGGYTSQIPWLNAPADCIVVACSDHRFEDQTRDFLIHGLGFRNPHVLQWPSGVTIASSLAVLVGSLPKAFDVLFQKALKVTHAKTLIVIAHEDCGAYKGDDLVDRVARRFVGKSVKEIQVAHLNEAVRGLRPTLHGITVRGFYGDVIQTADGERVNFKEVSVSA